MPSHSHTVDWARNFAGNNRQGLRVDVQANLANAYSTDNTGGGGAHSHNMSANFSGTAVTPTGNFSGSATSVIQPYVAVKFMIKT